MQWPKLIHCHWHFVRVVIYIYIHGSKTILLVLTSSPVFVLAGVDFRCLRAAEHQGSDAGRLDLADAACEVSPYPSGNS